MSPRKKLFFVVITMLGTLLLSLITIAYLTFEERPLVKQTDPISPKSLNEAKSTIKQIKEQLLRNDKHQSISIGKIAESLKLLSRSIPGLSTRLNQSNNTLLFAVSLHIPGNLFGNYLNISILFTNNNDFSSGEMAIGSLKISNKLALKLISISLPFLFNRDIANSLTTLIDKSSFNQKNLSFDLNKNIDIKLLIDQIKLQLKSYHQAVLPEFQFSNTHYYYDFLVKLSQYANGIDEFSLFDIIKPLFKEAHLVSNRNLGGAAKENEDALIALGLFLGDHQLKSVLNQFTHINLQPHSNFKVRLAGREDLKLHFLYSSIIQILTNKGVSMSLGEIKEISDMNTGGSGFSFIDLAADRAGVKLAIMATSKNGGASFLQSFLATAESENDFFPNISILPENMSHKEFLRTYKNTSSDEYQLVVREIDRRVAALPLYSSYP